MLSHNLIYRPSRPDNRLHVHHANPKSISSWADVAACIQYLVHEPVSYERLLLIHDTLLLSSSSNPLVLTNFAALGGSAVLSCLCDFSYENGDFCVDLFDKVMRLARDECCYCR